MGLVTFFNDNQVKEILLRRTDLLRNEITQVLGATPLLAAKIGAEMAQGADAVGFVYVSVSPVLDHGRI